MDTARFDNIEALRASAAKEFPDDPALQSVHIARKLLARGAELEGVSYLEHIRSTVRRVSSSDRQ